MHRSIARTRSAFTLIELLVVIAIVAVLAAIIFPVLSSVQERSRTTSCLNNLRQIASALILFAGEHDGDFPVAGGIIPHGQTDPQTKQPGWTEQLEFYLGTSTNIYICPGSSRVLEQNKQYSYYMGCHAPYAQAHGFAALHLVNIQNPATYILAGDSTFTSFHADDADKDDFTQSPAFSTNPAPFHGGRVNLVYVDGHSETATKLDRTRMSNMYDGTWQDPH